MKKLHTILLFLVSISITYAQSGTLDPTFGTNGIVTTVISGTFNFSAGTVVQSDGKIVVAGYAGEPSSYKAAVARYNTDGTLDTSYGNAGTLIIPVGANKSYATDVALQDDGKIVLGARTWDNVSGNFAVIRLNIDGTLDTSFGTGGLTIASNGNDVAETVAIQDDGKIVLGGYTDDDFSTARFNTDGTLDTSFGTNGWSITEFDTSLSFIKEIGIQDDGKIVLAGFIVNSKYQMAAARINADGTIDNTFGTNGKVFFNVGPDNDFLEGMAIQADGKILLGGHSYVSSPPLKYDMAIVRLNIDGSFDTSYGNNGVSTARIVDGANYTRRMTIQADGKALLVGFTVVGTEYNIGMARFDTDGNLDASFGTNGMVSTDINGREDYGNAIAIQPDGKIIIAGNSYTSTGTGEIVVVRYDNGTLGKNDNAVLNNQIIGFYNSNSNTFNLQSENNIIEGVTIYNMTGQLVETFKNDATIFSTNVSEYATGVYLVTINSGNQTSHMRFIKS
ncbi:T9SS type A sorting domain-containing protein [Ulvibacter antarcticus]|uniref:Putative delta-60 repeat protein/predicted secreted protein (Por secretion system target) n=1 Tax=Ulvibacter antarcticus TaxID=442714 RepID=A0A3L9YDG3_9FLAO|nr:T9SS type A sorting domain-containing protein [Ulvibacter antarcticus]RMA58743.1 putative delta-60 repeat protein/predicted secreted protein (Por secretion system target) [Ulvibacter antarcticus]